MGYNLVVILSITSRRTIVLVRAIWRVNHEAVLVVTISIRATIYARQHAVLTIAVIIFLKPNSITQSGSNQLRTSSEPAPNQIA